MEQIIDVKSALTGLQGNLIFMHLWIVSFIIFTTSIIIHSIPKSCAKILNTNNCNYDISELNILKFLRLLLSVL